MTRIPAVLVALCLVAACGPPGLYYKQGVPVQHLLSDEAQCGLDSVRAVPVDNRTRFIPGTREPRRICDAAGKCTTIWVQVTPDRWETYDANEDTRRNFERNCMITKGYQRISLPSCSSQIAENVLLSQSQVMPPLTQESCAVRLRGGGWQIVTPGLGNTP